VRVLVTGCAGFIGFHLCERLLDDGHDVIGVDDLSTGQLANVGDLQARPRFHFAEHNIVEPLPVEGPFAIVYNLACPASPVDFGPRRLAILDVCSRGVWNLLEFCRQRETCLLHASTSEVYGDPQEHPQGESYWGHVNPIGPRSCYDEGKRFAEALIYNYVSHYDGRVRVARIFNTYGPRMRLDDGRALPNFITQALAGERLTVHGDGGQTRSFCYVTDLVDGLVRLANSDVTEPVNLGNPAEISILGFAQDIIRLTASRSEIACVERPEDDPNRRCPDITRARARLGWEPVVDRAKGLARTIAWFQENARAGR
jgi:nucleoside-diphosphate-sugar epimerase